MAMAPEAPNERLQVELELEVGSEPIRGAVGVPPAPTRSFTGWLGLMKALDELRAAPPVQDGRA